MIISRLTGGLGNQLFQYAFARYLQEVYKETIYFDLSRFSDKSYYRGYCLNYFILNNNVKIPPAFFQFISRITCFLILHTSKKIYGFALSGMKGYTALIKRFGIYYVKDAYNYNDFVYSKRKIKTIRGYFQNPKYFEGIKNILIDELQIKNRKNIVSSVINAIDDMPNHSVCIHIRRGDYLSQKYRDRFDVCNETYYRKGIDYILSFYPEAFFYVFSNSRDDLNWIKENYFQDKTLEGKLRYVDFSRTEIEDFYLMSLCKHFIISNSSFSWWAAYLYSREESKVVAPSPWLHSDEKWEEIYCKEWHIIKV